MAVYECAHGMPKQVFVTLSTCVALFDLIKLSLRKPDREPCSEEVVSSLNAAIIMLDRMIPLSNTLEPLPLVRPSKQPSALALESGRALEYFYAVQLGVEAAETYDELMMLNHGILLSPTPPANPGRAIKAQGPPTFDSVAAKALMALQYSQRMAWDMVHVMIQKIQREEDLPSLPFAGVCCVIRAAIAVLETKRYTSDEEPRAEEVHGVLLVLSWFARRWSVGVQYLQRARELAFGYVVWHPTL
ncbi:hypothetical protein PMIN07_007923 [Paraphaeosphaeria minitans]